MKPEKGKKMKAAIKGVLFLLFLTPLMIFSAVMVLGIQKKPWVTHQDPLSFDRVRQVKEIVDKIKPARMKERQMNAFTIDERDLNLVIGYAVSQGLKTDNVRLKTRLTANRIKGWLTVVIPATPLGGYVNLAVEIQARGKSIDLLSFQIGDLKIPGRFVNPVLKGADKYLSGFDLYRNLSLNANAVKQMTITDKWLKINYEWDPGKLRKLKKSTTPYIWPITYQKKMIVYHNGLVRELAPFKRKTVSLAKILPPMFKLATTRSDLSKEPLSENRALIQVMAIYATGIRLDNFVQADLKKEVSPRIPATLTLKNRKDLARHFLVSAGLSVSAGSSVADFIGLAKEVEDADGGSGFSFADLAADRAGVRWGELAVRSEQTAIKLGQEMITLTGESDIMPAVDQLPEGIQALEFKKRFIDLDSKNYTLVEDEIERRIRACRIYRQ